VKLHSIFICALITILVFPSAPYSANAQTLSITPSQADAENWIAYVDKDHRLYVIHPDGSGKTGISLDLPVITGIRWSSSGRYLSFISGTPVFSIISSPYTLWIWDMQTNQSVTTQDTNISYAWSPTDDVLAFISFEREANPSSFPSENTYALQLLDLTTGEQQIIVPEMKGSFGWLPDGKRIAFEPYWEAKPFSCAYCFEGWVEYSGINTIDIQTGEISTLIEPRDNPLTGIQISPQGSVVSFEEVGTAYARYDGPGCAWRSTSAPIVDSGTWQELPNSYCVWSPNEKNLACHSGGCGISGEAIGIYDSNYQLLKEIPQITSHLSNPSPSGDLLWSPDETKLAIGIANWDFPSTRNATLIIDAENWNTIVDLQGAAFDWSPDGNSLLLKDQSTSDDGELGIYDVDSQEFQSIGVSSVTNAAWQPGKTVAISAADWQSWKTRKVESVEALQEVAVELGFDQDIYGLLPTPNEAEVITLLSQLPNEPADLSPQQVEAFYRMLLEEETLARIQDSYEISSNDLGEWMSNLVKFFTFSNQILQNNDLALTWTRSLAEDAGHVVIHSIEDPQDRQSMRTFYDAALVIGFNQGDYAEYVQKDMLPDIFLRYQVARDKQQRFTDVAQPVIDQGLNSYYQSTPFWEVTGSRQDAEGTTGYLAKTAKDFAETYHENYDQSIYARDILKAMDDIAEIFGSPNIPVSKVIESLTKASVMLVDVWSIAFNILPPLNCSLTMAEAVGSQSFQPNIQRLPDCRLTVTSSSKLNKVLLSSTYEIDKEAWAAFRTAYSAALDEYADQAQSIQDQLDDGKPISKQDRKDLQETLSRLKSLMAQGSALLTPTDGQVWDETTLSAFQGMMKIKAQTAMLLYVLDIPKDSLKDVQVKEAVSQTFTTLQSDIAQSQADLETVTFTGPPMGMPLVETENDPIHANHGEVLEIQVRVRNIGSAPLSPGEVMAYPTGSEPGNAMPVSSLDAGQEQVLTLQVKSIIELPGQIEITYTTGDQTITRKVLMVEENPAVSPGGERLELIVGGLIMLLGGFVVVTGIVLLRRKKNIQR